MEKTIENKARFFALYWGQCVAVITTCSYTHPLGMFHCINKNVLQSVESEKFVKHKYSLELKPLSSISDEDAKELSLRLVNVVGWDNMIKTSSKELVKELVGNYSRLNLIHLLPAMFIDKCRQLGYAVPIDDLQVETMVKYGWIKLKE